MTTEKALEVKRALLMFSELLDIMPEQVAVRICMYDQKCIHTISEALEIWSKFNDADIVERGKMLGYDIIVE